MHFAFASTAMVAQHLTMIGQQDDVCVAETPGGFQRGDDLAELGVEVGNVGEVTVAHFTPVFENARAETMALVEFLQPVSYLLRLGVLLITADNTHRVNRAIVDDHPCVGVAVDGQCPQGLDGLQCDDAVGLPLGYLGQENF